MTMLLAVSAWGAWRQVPLFPSQRGSIWEELATEVPASLGGQDDSPTNFTRPDVELVYPWVEYNDSGSRFSFNENGTIVTLNGFHSKSDEAYAYQDYGTNYFSGNFEFQFDVEITEFDTNEEITVFALSNNPIGMAQDDWVGWAYGNIFVSYFHNLNLSQHRVYLQLPGISTYQNISSPVGTHWYFTVERDLTVGTHGTVYCYIYSDSGRETLLYTLSREMQTSVDSVSGNPEYSDYYLHKYRYLYAFNYGDTGGSTTYAVSGTISGLTRTD